MRPFRRFQPRALILFFLTVALLAGTISPLLVTKPLSATLNQSQAVASLDLKRVTESSPPAIEGWVTDLNSTNAVPGAHVIIDGNIEAIANADGYFRFEREQVQSTNGSKQIDLSVDAQGYASWSISNATYYVGDTLRVYSRLNAASHAPTRATAPAGRGVGQVAVEQRASALDMPQASFASVTAAPPTTIRVYRTQSSTVEVVPFRDYLKHTLPNEWIPSWSPEALKAGAMAVKTYAWYWVARGGKQVALGADLKDNVEDQVYDPNVSYASTDAAVDATYNYAMLRNGSVFQAQYCAGSYIADPTNDCPWAGPYMTQWGSAYYANAGKTWGWIIGFYYFGATISPTPPGGGYDGNPPSQPTRVATPTRPAFQPTATPVVTSFAVGQGSNQADAFQDAYDRNGGEAALGRPSGPVRWWLPYVSESNVLAQPFTGPQGRGDTWLVFDVLQSDTQVTKRAFMITGDIAMAYREHTPAGPEWVGAPTSDPYVASGVPSQGFAKGTLLWDGQKATVSAWPDKFNDWKAEYFVGYQPTSAGKAPDSDLPGRPALITNALTASFQWDGDLKVPQSLGVGGGAWSVQLTKVIQSSGGPYDFTLSANSGMRLWVDGMLAVNDWNWATGGSDRYNADLSPGRHTIRVQYYSVSSARDARLDFSYGPRADATAVPATPVPQPTPKPSGTLASLRLRVAWLGRQPASASWVQPVTLYLSEPKSARVLHRFSGQTDRNGIAYFGDLPVGNFNVHIKGAHTLQVARANISLTGNVVTELDMKAQIEGDVDGDNCVTVDDFTLVQAMLGASNTTPGFNPAADLNGDGIVTMSDISLLRSGFDRCGDVSADNDYSAMRLEASPSLADTLLPWTQPERLDHNLSFELTSSKSKVKKGETVEVQVVAATGAQPVDGVSFLLSYDPKKLVPVDSSGKDAVGVEPGMTLPAVMGNWVDRSGGRIGYAAGILQGDAPQGRLLVATIKFRVLGGAASSTQINFAPLPSPHMQITNGGTNLLARSTSLALTVTP
jgi:hypothetical protein